MKTIQLVDSDNDKAIHADKGDIVKITLPWNPKDGYMWQESDTTAGNLEDIAHKGNSPALVVFAYRIAGPGVIMLDLAKPWDENQLPLKKFVTKIAPSRN